MSLLETTIQSTEIAMNGNGTTQSLSNVYGYWKFLERVDGISHFSIERDEDGVLSRDFLFKVIAVRHSEELEWIWDDFKKSRRKVINYT